MQSSKLFIEVVKCCNVTDSIQNRCDLSPNIVFFNKFSKHWETQTLFYLSDSCKFTKKILYKYSTRSLKNIQKNKDIFKNLNFLNFKLKNFKFELKFMEHKIVVNILQLFPLPTRYNTTKSVWKDAKCVTLNPQPSLSLRTSSSRHARFNFVYNNFIDRVQQIYWPSTTILLTEYNHFFDRVQQ